MTKKEKSKLPKKVAGLRVPEAVRYSDWINAALRSAVVREAVAAALIAGAGAAATVIAKKAPGAAGVKKAGSAVAETAEEGASAAKDLTQAAVGALAGLATDAAKSMLSSHSTASEKPAKARGAKSNGGKRKSAKSGASVDASDA